CSGADGGAAGVSARARECQPPRAYFLDDDFAAGDGGVAADYATEIRIGIVSPYRVKRVAAAAIGLWPVESAGARERAKRDGVACVAGPHRAIDDKRGIERAVGIA